MSKQNKGLSLKSELLAGVFIILLSVLISSAALAQDSGGQYGPPAGIPNPGQFMPPNIPAGMNIPSGMPGIPGNIPNMPTNIPNGPMMNSGAPSGDPSQMMQQGPSEEQMAQINKQRVEQMKKGLKGFAKEMTRVKTQIANYQKKGVIIPEELKKAMENINEAINKINTSEDADELQEVVDNFQESIDVVQEWMPKLPKLAQLPKIIKQAEKEITKAETAYNKDKKQVEKAKLDAGDILADFKTAIEAQKTLLAEVKTLAKTDFDGAFDKLTEDFFSNLDNMWENEKVIQMSLNLKKGVLQMAKEIKTAETTTNNLKKKKINTSELEALVATAKTQYETVKKLASVKPLDFDAVIEAIDTLMETKQAFSDKLEEVTGNTEFKPMMTPTQNFQMNIPKGFDQ